MYAVVETFAAAPAEEGKTDDAAPAAGPPLASIFRPGPWQWGMRGDPHLWSEMEVEFEKMEVPATPGALAAVVHEAFARLSGEPMSHPERFYVPRLDHGGMSAGHVNPGWWRDKALPLLLERQAALMSGNGGADGGGSGGSGGGGGDGSNG
jgi:molybdenum cofactor cytidylyltransferase